jgi:hypothetical protein
MLSFTRWCATTLTVIALVAGTAFVGPRLSTASAVLGDHAVRSGISFQGTRAFTQRGCLPKQHRSGQGDDLPLVSPIFTACIGTPFNNEGSSFSAAPRDSRIAHIHDATGPPDALLT